MQYKNINIRESNINDVSIITSWWNDGTVMAHAGFSKGLGIKNEEVREIIENQSSNNKIMILEIDSKSVGEIGVRFDKEECEIGIKICDFNYQNKGYGKVALSLLIDNLFKNENVKVIKLDTNLNNIRAQKTYEKLGFKKDKIVNDVFCDDCGVSQSAVFYTLKKDDFVSFL